MTYIEFFDKASSENISACLTYAPDRVIYIGDNAKLMKRYIARYEKLFDDRGQHIDFSCRQVSKYSLDAVTELLTELVETYDDCVFDVTGGDELMLLGLGVVSAKYPERNLQLHRINLRNNKIYDCDKDGVTVYRDTPALSVEENIRIYGGDVLYGGVREENTYRWELTEEFRQDVQTIWEICRQKPGQWNSQIGVLSALEEIGTKSEDGLTVSAPMEQVRSQLSKDKAAYKYVKRIIESLLDAKLLTEFSVGEQMCVSYKDLQVKRCLTKAGQALEMMVYITAKSLKDAAGQPVFGDVCNGVVIDWDGKFHDEETEDEYDTENEMDVLMMHGAVPVFVSCKNGRVTADELYKLNTVAERFGGRYAKKVLVATSIPEKSEAGLYLRQRVKDMQIRLLEPVRKLSDEEFAEKLQNAWQ